MTRSAVCVEDETSVTLRCPWQADAPPYAIANNNVRLPLSFRAIPVTARHYDGSLQYDAHNIYGLSQAAATFRALNTIYEGKPQQ